MNDDLREQVARYFCFHSINLGDALVTPGTKSLVQCTAEANAIFNRIDLNGRTVLDVGAWNGVFSFEAKRRGYLQPTHSAGPILIFVGAKPLILRALRLAYR